MSEPKYCSLCGLQSRSPRFAPIERGMCKPCRDREAARKAKIKQRLKELRAAMAAATKCENYELSARYRDEIKATEKEL